MHESGRILQTAKRTFKIIIVILIIVIRPTRTRADDDIIVYTNGGEAIEGVAAVYNNLTLGSVAFAAVFLL